MISLVEVKKLAELARIEVSDAEAQGLAKDIEGILGYVALVQKISGMTGKRDGEALNNVMREDAEPHQSGVYTSALMSAVPETEDGFVRVPKIL